VRRVPGVGPATTEHLWTTLRALPEGTPLAEGLAHADVRAHLPRKAQKGFQAFADLMRRLTRPEAARTPGVLIEDVLAGGYAEYLKAEFAAEEQREEDIRQLAEFAARFEDLPRFLSEIALVAEFAAEQALAGDAETDTPDEYLTLSTVHQAKGLEWRAVFVLWLADGRFPLSLASRLPEEEEEERRLFYVAMTRARDELALVYPLTVLPRDGERILLRVSRFIEELPVGEEAPYDRLVLATVEEPPVAPPREVASDVLPQGPAEPPPGDPDPEP
jgi:DNA helicase-2/ATP-dependent DNA helicase PcrA